MAKKKSSTPELILAVVVLVAAIALIKYWYIAAALITLALALVLIARSKRKKAQAEYLALPVLFIGNKSTRTYHSLSCNSLSSLDAHNKIAFRLQGEAERLGYRPCGTCKPRKII